MSVFELFLVAAALAMDAVAVGMTNGMAEPRMSPRKAVLVAGAYALFQFSMPVAGYYAGSAFASLVERIAPWLSFVLLAGIGGKSLFARVPREAGCGRLGRRAPLGAGKLLAQAVATSLDALAVGVTFVAVSASGGLPYPAAVCALVIGAVTFLLSLAAVSVGKRAGDALAGDAERLGGAVLVLIGVKLLLEGLF